MSRHQVFRRGANLQRGSALIVSLSFLIVLTLLGVSSMGTSRLQLRMAINQQTAQKAFNACTSAIDMLLRTEDVYGQDIFKTSGVAQVFTYSASTATTETKFKKYSPRLSGNSIGKLGVYHSEIKCTGASPGNGESIQFQGYFFVGPQGFTGNTEQGQSL